MSKIVRAILVAVVAAVAAALLTAYFTFQQWSMEQSLSREQEDYETLNSAATEIAGQLSTVMTLQENLFFMFLSGFENKGSPRVLGLRHADAQTLYKAYTTAWNPLKEQYSLIISKASYKIDRFSVADNEAEHGAADDKAKHGNELYRGLKAAKFDCKTTLPGDQLPNFPIGWNRTSDNVATIYYCLLEVHNGMLTVRDWAESDVASDPPVVSPESCGTDSEPKVQCELDNYPARLQAFGESIGTALTALRNHHPRPSFWKILTARAS